MSCRVCDGHYGIAGDPYAPPRGLPSAVLVTDVARDPAWVKDVWELPVEPAIVPALGVPTWKHPTLEDAALCGAHRLHGLAEGRRVIAAGPVAAAALLGAGRHRTGVWCRDVMPVPSLPMPVTPRRDRLSAAYMARAALHPGEWEGRHTVLNSYSAARAALSTADAAAWDLETSGLDPRAPGAHIVCMSITTVHGGEVRETLVVPGELVPHLVDPTWWPEETIAHNGKYDQLWCYQLFGQAPPVTYDTMLAEHLIDPEGPKGLKTLGAKYLGLSDWSVDAKNVESLPRETVYLYAARDTEATARVRLAQSANELLLNDLLMPASKAITFTERFGVGLDVAGAKSLKIDLMKRVEEINNKVSAYGPCETPSDVSKLLYVTLGLPVLERTETGRPRVTGSILKRLEHPVASLLAERQKIQKGISAFLSPWLTATKGLEDPRLYSTFRLAGTATGRLSSGGAEGAAGINLQQVPRDKKFKRLITARDGYTLAELDYSQIELRVAAHLANEPTMLGIYRTGGDIHTRTAQAVTGREEVTKADRTKAKAVNFGFLYGMGAGSFRDYARDSYGVGLTNEEAADYRKRFFGLYSALPVWHRKTKEYAVKNGYIDTIFGRRRYLDGLKYGREPERGAALRQAVNTTVQSVASDIMILALGLIHRLIVLGPYDARIVATVHDSVLLEIAEDEAEGVARKVKYIMEHLPLSHFGVKLNVPIEAGLSIGSRWGEMEEL